MAGHRQPSVRRNLALALLLIGLFPALLKAASSDSNFHIEVGYFFSNISTQIKVDSALGGDGTTIDLEDDLGLSKNKELSRLDGEWRFADNHRLSFGYYQLNRAEQFLLQKEITVGDETYLIDTQLDVDFTHDRSELLYLYSLSRNETTEFAILGGVYWLNLGIQISAEADQRQDGTAEEGPLPVIGLDLRHRFTENWEFHGKLSILEAEVDEIDGAFLDTRFAISYYLSPHFAIGVSYNQQGADITTESAARTGVFDWDIEGGEFFFTFAF